MNSPEHTNDQADVSSTGQSVLLAEYAALRSEIMTRMGLQHQLISLAVIAPGTLAAVAIQSKAAVLILIYPVFGLFLASAWAANDRAVRQGAEYIRVRIEGVLGFMAWESFRQHARKTKPVISLNFLAARGIFLGAEILTIVVGVLLASPQKVPLADILGPFPTSVWVSIRLL